jgi:TonB family protein
MRQQIFISLVVTLMWALAPDSGAPRAARRVSVAVLDLGAAETARRATDRLAVALAAETGISLIDRAQSRAAARGIGYTGSLNMTLAEARDLGAAIGCEFYITGDAQTLRRAPSDTTVYYEAYASVFIVSARTGRLILWDRPSCERATPAEAESSLLDELGRRAARYATAIREQSMKEPGEQARAMARNAPVIEDAAEEAGAGQDYRPPQPYRRLRPAYPETAARAEAEATIDALVEIDASGEVGKVEIVRWGGFGLDEAVVATIRQMHFRPAMRDGAPIAVSALLRYNFRRPAK